ncbi:MAG: alpha/beta fold hydrolase, partial [Azonexus sp.]
TVSRTSGAPNLMVLLPGAYMTPEDFESNGFFDTVSKRRLALDVIAVDLDLSAISGGLAISDLHRGILEPVRRHGYQKIWLGGISLGGLLALACCADMPGHIDGLCLLAPYPGSRLTTDAIARAGGLARWQATADELADPEFRIWRWLRQAPVDLQVFIGYGSEDRFASGMKQIADCFPPAASMVLPGGHDWPVWKALWENFLDRHFLSA